MRIKDTTLFKSFLTVLLCFFSSLLSPGHLNHPPFDENIETTTSQSPVIVDNNDRKLFE